MSYRHIVQTYVLSTITPCQFLLRGQPILYVCHDPRHAGKQGPLQDVLLCVVCLFSRILSSHSKFFTIFISLLGYLNIKLSPNQSEIDAAY